MIRRQYRCPDCKGLFLIEIENRNRKTPPPDDCPLCHGTGERDRTAETTPREVEAPYLPIGKSKIADGYYRAQEEASGHRAQMAAAMGGGDVSDYSDMKITNMRDNMREGDIAAIPVANDVSRMVDQNANLFGLQTTPDQRAAAAQYASTAHQGLVPYAGAHAKAATRSYHAEFDTHTRVNMSDNPTLEWMAQHTQPVVVSQGRRRR